MHTYIGLYIKLGATKLEWYFLISEKTFQFSDWDELLNLNCNKVKLKKWAQVVTHKEKKYLVAVLFNWLKRDFTCLNKVWSGMKCSLCVIHEIGIRYTKVL